MKSTIRAWLTKPKQGSELYRSGKRNFYEWIANVKPILVGCPNELNTRTVKEEGFSEIELIFPAVLKNSVMLQIEEAIWIKGDLVIWVEQEVSRLNHCMVLADARFKSYDSILEINNDSPKISWETITFRSDLTPYYWKLMDKE